MATYREIQEYVRTTRQFVPKTCWIAHILSEHNLTKRQSPNRIDATQRSHPCPASKRAVLEEAMREIGALP